ncbi:hypothetical protein BI084_gp74 [Gordonia phage Terapin]|uniref:Uncharacterized protein n=5 Tax=Terapinvirus terapin TaxID=2734283 RepID=A0A345MBB3_9CAUD|nr:hypothetical protein BI084_gp74 [Gordonia phage Terapin]AVP43350.1 hypothetical protein PBI_DJOKOVIC_73 [Gordonia phage Djokovic]AXH67784.1 hypothetical protein SEA_BEYONCAGE_73 [Gordonia phage Beyoncage]QOC56218.1 hypothetical protein SEA_SIENNA_73 [Gordonia phage Sienna]QOC56643.1 hypothetical protein SEA_BITESIZE_73 [Gordonia phage BiteSize]QYW00875.1 hypothetical protein SEA_MADI_72 [Gordonia phage Madi]
MRLGEVKAALQVVYVNGHTQKMMWAQTYDVVPQGFRVPSYEEYVIRNTQNNPEGEVWRVRYVIWRTEGPTHVQRAVVVLVRPAEHETIQEHLQVAVEAMG